MDDLERLEKNAPLILCKLEKIFPPAFFDIMIHLIVHLPKEAKLGGPVHPRWMFLFERYLGSLKKYVRNRARPEGSIAEGYIANECLTFMSKYLHGIETKFTRKRRNYDYNQDKAEELVVFSLSVRPFGLVTPPTKLSQVELDVAHKFILNNCDEIEEYRIKHKEMLQRIHPENVDSRHEDQFTEWFKDHINQLHIDKSLDVSEELWALANGPIPFMTKHYSGCIGWFDFKDWETDPNVEMYVDDMLQNSYRQWRNTMHIDYKMLKAAGKDPLTSCPYDWIEQDEWKSMCDWFEDPIFKKKSEANTKNRAMLPYPHTGGSKSNHVRAQEMVPPSAIDAWTAAHIKKDGQFVNNTAKSLDDELKEERRQCIENGEIVNEVKIMENVLGKRAGRAKGLGMGVIPPQSSRKPESSANRALLEELKQCKEKIQCYEERIQAQDTQIQNLVQSQQGIQ
ncbi:uncharacterized protein [Coffea arabica]|uniref:Uncharacterized protein isoform X2 n=1 Tax=Coffea arabica TaxID=13443 RepID=A0ABM4V018_COFAR